MSWLEIFKNDERTLYWLVNYIHHNNLFRVKYFPTNMEEAREIIQRWESEFINGVSERSKHQLSNIMGNYIANVLPIESFDWLSVKNPKQLSWVLFYINLNPIPQFHSALPDKYYRNFASNIEEAYPLIIKTFDAAMTHDGLKQNYLLALKCAYSQYVIGKSPLPWLDMKDEETCSWVWRYLVEKVEEASKQKDVLQFIKPIDNETIYWSVIALISNWKFLKGRFIEAIKVPILDHIITTKSLDNQIELNYFDSESITKNSNETENTTFNNMAFIKPSNIALNEFNASEYILVYPSTSECINGEDMSNVIYTDTNYPYEVNEPLNISRPKLKSLFLINLKHLGDIYLRLWPEVVFKYQRTKATNPIIGVSNKVGRFTNKYEDKLPTTDELTTSLYNAHKQKILRQKNNSSFGLTKTNQRKLASYAKKLNTTEKKALNKIISDYKP